MQGHVLDGLPARVCKPGLDPVGSRARSHAMSAAYEARHWPKSRRIPRQQIACHANMMRMDRSTHALGISNGTAVVRRAHMYACIYDRSGTHGRFTIERHVGIHIYAFIRPRGRCLGSPRWGLCSLLGCGYALGRRRACEHRVREEEKTKRRGREEKEKRKRRGRGGDATWPDQARTASAVDVAPASALSASLGGTSCQNFGR